TLRTTFAACSRGRRNGAAGTTVAAHNATAPPTRASVQRVNAAVVLASSVVTTIDCTAAWIVKTCPLPSRTATVIASTTTSAICPGPLPITCTSRSPPKTPRATPTATSATRRRRCPYDVPRDTTAAT